MDGSKIEWTDATWNPIRGCSRVSEGCRNCYAERVAARFSYSSERSMPYWGLAKMTPEGPRWTGEVRLIEDKLEDPLRWKRPRRIFVNSMSDLFHEKVPDEWIDRIFAVMAMAPQHTFQILTKRPERMLEYLGDGSYDSHRRIEVWNAKVHMKGKPVSPMDWPLPNVWLGVSVEDQKTADERIPFLLQTPAAVRWISYEPALLCVDLHGVPFSGFPIGSRGPKAGLDWVVVGGESGPDARPFDVYWARKIVEQCRAAAVPVFVKQLGAKPYYSPEQDGGTGCYLSLKNKKGGDMAEWPEYLRVREFPKTY